MSVERVDYSSDQEYENALASEEACYRQWQEQERAKEQAAKEDSQTDPTVLDKDE